MGSFAESENNVLSCEEIFVHEPLLSSNFSARIAHGIHSLTLEDIQKYFNPRATLENNIPVVNKNLSSPIPILNDAPRRDVDSEMWTHSSEFLNEIIQTPPEDDDLCSCLKDVENNGIYYHLRQIAMLIREPELAYNDENKRLPREGRARGQYHGNYN